MQMSRISTWTKAAGGRERGFTLTELLVVLTLVVMLLSMAGPAVIDWGRTARVRSAAASVAASLTRTRAEAMAHLEVATWFATNVPERNAWAYAIWLGEEEPTLLGSTNVLARGLWVGDSNGLTVSFRPDGTVIGHDAAFPIWERDRGERGLVVTVMVSRVTGHVRTVER